MENRHLEIALRMQAEAREYIAKAEPIQASEKLYKASEEAIKALAEHFNLSEWEDAERKGRWTVALLDRVVRRLSEKFPELPDWWQAAWYVHVEGFHEARLDVEAVEFRVKDVEKLVALANKTLQGP